MTMKHSLRLLHLLLLSAIAFRGITHAVSAELVLDEKIMNLSKIAGELSVMAYAENPSSDAYDSLDFFDDEPDQALVAKAIACALQRFAERHRDWTTGVRTFCLAPKKSVRVPSATRNAALLEKVFTSLQYGVQEGYGSFPT
jgi:hypothetical protein